MKKYSPILKTLLLLLLYNHSRAQQPVFRFDSLISVAPAIYTLELPHTIYFPVYSPREYIIEREPAEGDTALITGNRSLVKTGPDYKNYETYSNLAAAYWRAHKNSIAKSMFLLVEQSKELYYTGTQFHSAGNTYEYGSFTSNFKNEASLYLCKIFIEEKNYKAALNYLVKADRKYHIQFNCGTGANSYTHELNELYVICYRGLGLYNKVIGLYLQTDFYHDEEFTSILKKRYSLPEIKRLLQLAVDNITLVKDDWVSTEFVRCGDSEEDSITAQYTNGTAYTVLFGHRAQ